MYFPSTSTVLSSAEGVYKVPKVFSTLSLVEVYNEMKPKRATLWFRL